MGRLALLLLGPPRVELDGLAVRFDTRKALALLACLALAEGPLRRDTLAALLWPDYAQGRAALRRTLASVLTGIGEQWVIVQRDELALRRDHAFLIDVDLFQARIAETSGTNPEVQRAALRAAAALYRDDFLTGFTLRDSPAFDDWQLAQAERLRRMLAETLEQLAHLEAVSGDLVAALATAQRWLALDPLHEQAHRAVMTLYAQSGQRSAAMQQYRDCVRMLERELGVPPLAETTALYQAVTAGLLPAPPPSSSRPAPHATTPLWRATATAPSPLVGREAEWALLTRAFDDLRPNGTLIVLDGPAGIGKTRLAEELLAYGRSQGAVTLQVRCHEGEAGLAFAPFIALLRSALALPGAAARLADVPIWLRGAAAHLVPELADSLVSLPPASSDARMRLFEGVAAVLFAAAVGSAPALVLLDDLQWADHASLELFAFLARRLSGQPLGLVATWRDDLAVAHPLHTLLAELRRGGTLTHLPLGPLSRVAVAALLTRTPGLPALRPGMADHLFAETEGLPLLVVAYLAMFREGASLAAGGVWELPSVARDLLQARLRRASPMAGQLLAAAAVVGRTFDSATLRTVSGRSEDEVVSGLEELMGLGIVVEGHTYDFSHGKLRDLAYAETSLARRRLLHRRAAESLSARTTAKTAGALAALTAQHYQLAGQDELAAAAFARAGQYARDLAATTTALGHYSAALALGHPEPGPLHIALGDLYTLEGRYDEALASYETAAALAAPAELATVEANIAEVHRRRGAWALALRHLAAGLATLGEAGDPGQRARLTADRSLTAYQAGQIGLAVQLAQAALGLAEHAGDARALAQAHNLLGLLAREQGELGGARAHLERSLALAERLGNPGVRAAALHNLALARGMSGEHDEALALAEQALALCAAQGDRHRAAAVHNTLADLLHAAGREADSMEQLKLAVTLFATISPDTAAAHPAIWQLTAW